MSPLQLTSPARSTLFWKKYTNPMELLAEAKHELIRAIKIPLDTRSQPMAVELTLGAKTPELEHVWRAMRISDLLHGYQAHATLRRILQGKTYSGTVTGLAERVTKLLDARPDVRNRRLLCESEITHPDTGKPDDLLLARLPCVLGHDVVIGSCGDHVVHFELREELVLRLPANLDLEIDWKGLRLHQLVYESNLYGRLTSQNALDGIHATNVVHERLDLTQVEV